MEVRQEQRQEQSRISKDEVADAIWEGVIRPIVDAVANHTKMSVVDLVARLIESNTTLGALARHADLRSLIMRVPIYGEVVIRAAMRAKPEDVDGLVNYVLEVIKRKDGVLYRALSDERGYAWLRQSIFELWRIVRGEMP